MSKERPILFSAPMVRAILEGRKTQTRRPAGNRKHPDFGCDMTPAELQREDFLAGERAHIVHRANPFGQPGDQLWVRENCQGWAYEAGGHAVRYPADGGYREIGDGLAEYMRWVDLCCYAGKEHAIVPSIHMPRWASRILMEITDIRVERLQDMTPEDAIAEGVVRNKPNNLAIFSVPGTDIEKLGSVAAYAALWESINGPGSWDANPWVWAVEFKVIQP
jgi:hypothetical protein